MVVIIYAAERGQSIAANLGRPEYSYYFIFKAFRAVLRRLAEVIETADPENEVDPIYEKCRSMGEACVFLSFSPPHKTATGFKCPTTSVFAWEFPTIPTEPFAGDPRNDWRTVLSQHGSAITLSSFAVAAVRKAMGSHFPVWSIPAPVWDDYVSLYDKREPSARSKGFDLVFEGTVIDFNGCDAPSVPEQEGRGFVEHRSTNGEPVRVYLNGVIYTTVFNPIDDRKNWQDLLSAFVWAFRSSADVTLVLKVIYRDFDKVRGFLTDEVFKCVPFKCRVVILHGYLSDSEYAKLIRDSTYVVNTSHAEGQCLPLAEYMSAGKPAISPVHSAMGDYINKRNTFVVRSTAEITFWPHDDREALRTMWYRVDWESLYNAYLESYNVATTNPGRYARMSRSAVKTLRGYCSRALVEKRLKRVLRQRVNAHKCSTSRRRKAWRMAAGPIWKVWSVVFAPNIRVTGAARATKYLRFAAFGEKRLVWLKTAWAKSRRDGKDSRPSGLQHGEALPIRSVSESANAPDSDAGGP